VRLCVCEGFVKCVCPFGFLTRACLYLWVCNVWVCAYVGFEMRVCVSVWVCNISVCVCVGFVMCGCVYVWFVKSVCVFVGL